MDGLQSFFALLRLKDPQAVATITLMVIQWFFAFFMLIGWGINTGMAAYHFPYSTLTALFVYAGFNVLATSIVYVADYRSGTYIVLRALGGLFSFKPLEPLLRVLQSFSGPAELITIACITGCCLVGYIVGVLQRRVSPDPYSPRMMRRP